MTLHFIIIIIIDYYVDNKGSGSPPQFHKDTVNGLVYGIKHWYLWPPAEAFCVFNMFNAAWISQYNYYGNYSTDIECVQLPGDVL